MKLSLFAVLPVLVVAHNGPLHKIARQATTTSAPPSGSTGASPSSTLSSGAPPATGSATVSGSNSTGAVVPGSGTISSFSPPPTVPVTLLSSNPTAVPLTDITANMSSSATIPLDTTYAPGSQPTLIPGAPPLPDASSLVVANYPALDKPPPTDSPEVLQWIQDVQNTGVSIPNISVTVDFAACAGNPEAAADTSRCWWTCTGCTRSTDITTCPQKMTWGVTYDDGPGFYTPNLLAYLDQQSIKTTFFTIGSRVLESPITLQTEFMGGHQIGVHTWSHTPLTTQTNEEIIAEFGWTKKIIKDVTGLTPNTMRPPYGDIDDRVRAICAAMGLTPIIWTRLSPTVTFDTGDFTIDSGLTSVSEVISNFNNILSNATDMSTGFIVLEHDLFEQSVDVATGYLLPDALAHQPSFQLQPVFNCLNLSLSDAYIETNDNTTNPPPVAIGSTVSSGSTGAAQSTSTPSHASMTAGIGRGTMLTMFAAGLVGMVALF